jgi:hypothetical protein
MQRIVISYLLLLLIGFIDWYNGPEVRFGSLYLFLIVYVGWKLRSRPLYLFAVLTTGVWIVAELFMGLEYSKPWFFYWNMINKAGSVAIAVGILQKVKSVLHLQWSLICELRQTSLRVTQFEEIMPICRVCHEISCDADYKATLEKFLQEENTAASLGGICLHCIQKRHRRLAAIPLESYFPAKSSA